MFKHNKQLGYGNQLWRTKYSLRPHVNAILVGFTRMNLCVYPASPEQYLSTN